MFLYNWLNGPFCGILDFTLPQLNLFGVLASDASGQRGNSEMVMPQSAVNHHHHHNNNNI